MKVDYFEVTLDKGIDEPYLGGDPIKGIIEMVCSKQVRINGLIVRLTGVAETGWRSRQDDLPYESRHTFMDEQIDLTTTIAEHCTDDFELHEGKHSVEFEGRIPLDVLSSVERENHGSIRYMCTALMAIPEDGDTEVVSEKTFKVFSLLNLDAPYLHDKAHVTEEEEVTGCCGRRKGALIATMQVEQIGVMPGMTSKISLTVENKTKKRKKWMRKKENHECVLLSLCQQLDFVAVNRNDPMMIDRKSITIAVESHGTCKTKAGAGPQTKEIEFSVPPNLPPTSIHANRLVTVSYFFKLDLEHFDLVLPVIVGSSKSVQIQLNSFFFCLLCLMMKQRVASALH